VLLARVPLLSIVLPACLLVPGCFESSTTVEELGAEDEADDEADDEAEDDDNGVDDDDDDDDGDDGDDGDGGSGQTSDPDNAIPEVTVEVSQVTLTEGERLTFTVVASDADGADTLVGGTLRSGDQTLEFGPLVALSTESYTFELSWDELHALAPIELDSPESFAFRIEVADDAGAIGFAGVEVELTCGELSACDGHCIDKQTSNDHCGGCGNTCITHDHALDVLVGSCHEGACLPTFGECWSGGEFATCADYCASIGQTCAQGGGDGAPLLGCAGYTLRHYEAASGHACVDTPDFGWVSWAGCTAQIDLPQTDQIRCCCTQ